MTKPTGNPRGRPPKNSVIRNDGGYENVFLAVGTRQDRGGYTRFTAPKILVEQELTDLYVSDGFARRIVDTRAEDMTRAGFCIEGLGGEDEDGESQAVKDVMAALESVEAIQKLTTALRWSSLFGGGLVVMIVNDGGELTQPLNIDRANGLDSLRVYDRHRVSRCTYYDDPNDSRYGRTQTFKISPHRGSQYEVHESRCLIFDGLPVPDAVRETNDGWGGSAIQAAYTQLERFGMSHYWANALLERAQQAVHGIKNLSATLRAPGGEEQVRKRIDLVDMARSVNNTVVIDADGETYELKSTSFAGVTDIIDRTGEALCAVTAYPATLLLGKQQKGIGNSGEGDLENWYAAIGQDQNVELRGPLDTLVQVVLRSKGNKTNDYLIKFNPLWVPSDKERAEVEKTEAAAKKVKADTAAVYYGIQALDGSEVRKQIADEYKIDPSVEILPEKPEGEDFDENGDPIDPAKRDDAAPRTLYVSRKVQNVAAIKAWAKKQGLPQLQDDLHVTIAYSTKPIDWMSIESPWESDLKVPEGGPRLVEPLGNRGAVLLFTNDTLAWRNMRIRDAGASWDYPDYQPHISLTGESVDLSNVEPYRGEIILGPEIFEEIQE